LEDKRAIGSLPGGIKIDVWKGLMCEFIVRFSNLPFYQPSVSDAFTQEMQSVIMDALDNQQIVKVKKEAPEYLPTTAGELFKDLDE